MSAVRSKNANQVQNAPSTASGLAPASFSSSFCFSTSPTAAVFSAPDVPANSSELIPKPSCSQVRSRAHAPSPAAALSGKAFRKYGGKSVGVTVLPQSDLTSGIRSAAAAAAIPSERATFAPPLPDYMASTGTPPAKAIEEVIPACKCPSIHVPHSPQLSQTSKRRSSRHAMCKHQRRRTRCRYCRKEGVGGKSLCIHLNQKGWCLWCKEEGRRYYGICGQLNLGSQLALHLTLFDQAAFARDNRTHRVCQRHQEGVQV